MLLRFRARISQCEKWMLVREQQARRLESRKKTNKAINVDTNSSLFYSHFLKGRGNKQHSTAGKGSRRAPLRKTHKHRHNHERQVMRFGDHFRTIAHIQTHTHTQTHLPRRKGGFQVMPASLTSLLPHQTGHTKTQTQNTKH